MTKITFDSRAAGSGKTTNPQNGIIKKIKLNHALDEKTLVVVPSLALMAQYEQMLKDNNIDDFFGISHQNSTGVTSDIQEHIANNHPQKILIITSAAFLKLNFINLQHQLSEYNLIIDEAINLFQLNKFTHVSNLFVNNGFRQSITFPELEEKHLSVNNTRDDDAALRVNLDTTQLKSSDCTRDSSMTKFLDNNNFHYYISKSTYDKLIINKCNHALIIRVLRHEIWSYFKSVHIAAAHFTDTFMYLMLSKHYDLVQLQGTEFVKHKNFLMNFRFATLQGFDFDYSKNMKEKNPHLESFFLDLNYDLIQPNALLVQNRTFKSESDTDEADPNNQIKKLTDLSHNAHGINSYTDRTQIVITSAIRPNAFIVKFLKTHYNLTDEQILTGFTAYNYYQLIMRLAGRKHDFNGDLTTFIIDSKVGSLLTKYFENVNIDRSSDIFDNRINVKGNPGRPKKQLTPEETQARKEKERQRNSDNYQKRKDQTKIGQTTITIKRKGKL